MYIVTFSKHADKDKQLLKAAGLDKKAKELLNILTVDPLQNLPPFEKLIGNLANHYSRRINLQHRLIYCIEKNSIGLKDAGGNEYQGIVYVKRMWTHYE